MRLEDLLRAGSSDEDDERKPRMSNVGQCAILREFEALYNRPCPFKPGDLITPRKNSTLKKRGEPHLVLEVRANDPVWTFHGGEIHSNAYGNRLDVRVAVVTSTGAVVTFWNESFEHEPYTGGGSREGDSRT